MKKIILISLFSSFLSAEFVSVDCDAFKQVYSELQGISKRCEVSTNIHTFTQKVDSNLSGFVRYENGQEISFKSENGEFSVNIEQDRKFMLVFMSSIVSVPMKLSILSDGSESWKYLSTLTRRWRKYNFSTMSLTTFMTNNNIVYEDKSPAFGIHVQLVTDIFTFTGISDNNGIISIPITINTPFTTRAWNTKTNEWALYKYKTKIDANGNYIEFIDGKWVDSNKVWNN